MNQLTQTLTKNYIQLTDESGRVIKTYEYDSFGNEVNPDSKDENPFRYCGEYYDKETEEIYLRVRYYEPEVGRFLTRDTYTGEEDEPESLHLYAYCGNDSINFINPSGHRKVYARAASDTGKYAKPELSYKNKKANAKYICQYLTNKPYDLAMVFHGAYLRSADSKSTVQKDRAKKADYWYRRIK